MTSEDERNELVEQRKDEEEKRIFIRMKKKGTSECLNHKYREFPFEFDMNSVAPAKQFMVYRRVDEDKEIEQKVGVESFYVGQNYPLEKDKDILKYRITNEKVYKVLRAGRRRRSKQGGRRTGYWRESSTGRQSGGSSKEKLI